MKLTPIQVGILGGILLLVLVTGGGIFLYMGTAVPAAVSSAAPSYGTVALEKEVGQGGVFQKIPPELSQPGASSGGAVTVDPADLGKTDILQNE